MKRILILMACGWMMGAAEARMNERPNLVVLLADDQGWGDLGINGHPMIETPNIDTLATAGARFDRFYVSPVCSPTRAAFLTGRYPERGGVHDVSRGGERLDLDETTIADLFRRAGYATAAFGKWHNGTQYPYHPNGRGFDEFYGFCSGHWGSYFDPMLDHNGQLVTGQGYLADDLTTRAMAFIEAHRDAPFFVYLPYNTPHSPMQVPDPWWEKYAGKPLPPHRDTDDKEDHTRAALAMCENLDWNVGRLLGKLDDLQLAGHTIVVYFSDNGPNGHRWNGGMKGIKGSTDEGGVRSPLFIRWPAAIAPGTEVRRISSAMDLLPTLAELAGVPVAGTQPLDGISLAPLLRGEPDRLPDRILISHWNRRLSARSQDYRLDPGGHLFDMVADPGQYHDVADAHPEVAARLRQAVDSWQADLLPGLFDDTRPFVIGHPDCRFTQLPARDGTPHGNIQRSSRHPNDSYFTNWSSPQDAITWDCEVGSTGDYQVDIFSTCPPADVGSTIELSFNDSTLVGKVSVAHDPPLTGMEHDRYPREESYVKAFKPMSLGTIRLEKGQGTLTLRARDIPGSQVMDLRLLTLTRIDLEGHGDPEDVMSRSGRP